MLLTYFLGLLLRQLRLFGVLPQEKNLLCNGKVIISPLVLLTVLYYTSPKT